MSESADGTADVPEETPKAKSRPPMPMPSMRPPSSFGPPPGGFRGPPPGIDLSFPPRVPPLPFLPPMPMPSLLPSQLGFPGVVPAPRALDPPGIYCCSFRTMSCGIRCPGTSGGLIRKAC